MSSNFVPPWIMVKCDPEKVMIAEKAIRAANAAFSAQNPGFEEDCSGDFLFHFEIHPTGIGERISLVLATGYSPDDDPHFDIGDYSNF